MLLAQSESSAIDIAWKNIIKCRKEADLILWQLHDLVFDHNNEKTQMNENEIIELFKSEHDVVQNRVSRYQGIMKKYNKENKTPAKVCHSFYPNDSHKFIKTITSL